MPIISTVAEVREHVSLPANYSQAALPLFDTAVTTHLLPILGDALYSELETAYAGTPNAAQLVLLKKCRAVIVPFAILDDMATRHLNFSESGIMVNTNENTRSAFRWEYKELEEKLTKQGYAAQELLVVHLRANKAIFTAWADSPYNDVNGFAIIRDGSELNKVLSVNEPHRSYMLLRPLFSVVANTYLKKSLSDAYYEALHERIIAGTLQEAETDIMPLLQQACARMAMGLAAQELNVKMTNGGFTIVASTKDTPDSERTAAGDRAMMSFITEQKSMARTLFESYLNKLKKGASVTVFPEFFASDCYRAPGSTNFLDNTEFPSIVALS